MQPFYITIDTEPDCDRHWRRSRPLTFTSVTQGIPRWLRPLWNRYRIAPIYFVSPEVVSDDASCRVLQAEIAAGAIIGAHLHSEYIEPDVTIADPAGKPSLEYPCFAHSAEVEYQKIRNLTRKIEQRLGVCPRWYRAARYGADLDTIRALSRLGYRYDSSVTPGIDWRRNGGPDHSQAPCQPYWIARDDYYLPTTYERSLGILEVPITIAGKRFGMLGSWLPDNWLFYNWLRPSQMSVFEQKKLIARIRRRYPNPTLVLMFHSMEIMPGATPFVGTTIGQRLYLRRLELILAQLRRIFSKKGISWQVTNAIAR